MSNYLRRVLYAGYWLLVAFAFTYSGYCYFRAHDISSPRAAAVSSSATPSPEVSPALGASPESQEQGQVVESSEPSETVPAEPLFAAPTVAWQEVVGNAEPVAASVVELSSSIEESAIGPERALPDFSDPLESAGETPLSPAPESSVAVVKLLNGETKRVVQRYPRPGPEKVYNLEVFGEHVYHVTSDGILVHNYCVYVQIANIDPKSKGYVGRTINFVRRKGEHARNGRTIAMLPGFEDVSYEEMRYAEDQLIRKLKKAGLDNKMNGMSIRKSDALSKN